MTESRDTTAAPSLSPSQPKSKPKRTVLSVQALRGVAALLVVVHHTVTMWALFHPEGLGFLFDGSRGVDIFFVISGFIMPLSVRRLPSRLHSAGQFFMRRLERIVPLYWICTTVRALTPNAAEKGRSVYHLVASYLFLPSFNGIHEALPVLPPGWTLNLEMVFYALIAVSLLIGVPLRYFLPPVLLAISACAWLPIPATIPIDPSRLVLFVEFLLGLVLSVRFRALQAGARPLPFALCAAIVPLAGVALIRDGMLVGHVPVALLAFALVGCSIEAEDTIGRRLPRVLLAVGDSSYSLYLTHWFVVGVVHAVMARTAMRTWGVAPVVALTVALSCAVGWACYVLLEQRLNAYFQVRRAHAA